MNWIAHPLTLYGLVAASLAGCLLVFWSLKKELAQLRDAQAEESQRWVSEREKMVACMTELQQTLFDASQSQASLAALSAATESSAPAANMTRRSQVLRRWRRGETADQIAQELSMPRAEVELLIKAFQAAAKPAPPAMAAKA